MHELATNATKHGALKTADGRLASQLAGARQSEECRPRCRSNGCEDTIAAAEAPKSSGFGRLMLEQLVGASVSGTTVYELGNRRVVWPLNAPLDAIVVANGARNPRQAQ